MATIILIVFGFLSAIAGFLIMRKIKNQSINLPKTFSDIENEFGSNIAKNVERIYRLETANFESTIFKETNGAGMLAFNELFPYGWSSLDAFWQLNNQYEPVGFYRSENGLKYLKFKGNGGFFTLAEFLRTHGNNAGRWYSLVESKQEYYNSLIDNIQTSWT